MDDQWQTRKQTLLNNIWMTRKARINASERLKRSEDTIQGLNIYYSIVITALSILSLNGNHKDLDLFLLIFSIALTTSMVYISSMKYSDRAAALKENYLKLHKLYLWVESLDEFDEALSQYQMRYVELLKPTENHKPYDYYKALSDSFDKRFKGIIKIKYRAFVFIRCILVVISVALPFIIKPLLNLFPLVLGGML